jgi:tetratricopeptide (TPR) repeat protein
MLTQSSAAMLDELGQSTAAASQRQVSGEVELLAEDPVAAERELRPSIEVLMAAGNRWSLPSNAARLACAVARQGRGEEARVFVQMARDLAVPDDIDALSWAFAAEAMALRDEGRLEDAVSVCEEAVALLEPTDQLVAQGYALQNLADVLHFAGRDEEARAAAERALDRYERKGAILLVGRTNALLESIRTGP